MKALLLGASGQLGQALVAEAPAGVTTHACTRADIDLTDEKALGSLIRSKAPDIVINAAAYTRVDEAESNRDLAERVNAVAPGIIASAARLAGGRTVHISTDFVFDGSKSTPYDPGDAPTPLNVYGESKWRGEQAVSAADADALIVRTAWLYGPGSSNFVGTILRLASERPRLTVVDDQIGTPTSARSLATALWKMIAVNARGIYHFTDSGIASWYDFAVAIVEEAQALGLLDRAAVIEPITTAEYPTAATRPPYSVLEKSAAWAMLGWKAPHWRINLRSVLKEMTHHG